MFTNKGVGVTVEVYYNPREDFSSISGEGAR